MTTRTNGYSLAIEDPHPDDPSPRDLAALAGLVLLALAAIASLATGRPRPRWRRP